jgi:hypothetical protein
MANTTRIILQGDKLAADRLRLRHAVRVTQEFERLTYFQRLMQNERTIRFDNGSRIHLATRFGDLTAAYYAPPQVQHVQQERKVTAPKYIPFFRAYLEDTTPVWVLCRGGMNFGPPYEVFPDEFQRDGWARVYQKNETDGLAIYTILPSVNPLVTHHVDWWTRPVSSTTIKDDIHTAVGGGLGRDLVVEVVSDDVVYVRHREHSEPSNLDAWIVDVANGENAEVRWGLTQVHNFIWLDEEWFSTASSVGGQWGHRRGSSIGAASDADPYDRCGILTTVAYPDESVEPVKLTVIRNDDVFVSADAFYGASLGVSLQEENFFCWAAIGVTDVEQGLRGYRMGVYQDGVVSDVELPVNDTDRTFTAEDGTVLLYPTSTYLSSGLFTFSPVETEELSGFEPMFGIIKREVR